MSTPRGLAAGGLAAAAAAHPRCGGGGFAQLHGFLADRGVFRCSRLGRSVPAERTCTWAGVLARAGLAPPHATCLQADAALLHNAARRCAAGRLLGGAQGRLRAVHRILYVRG